MPLLPPLPGTGIDRHTGRPIAGFAHVQQSLEVIFTTHFGERVLRRWFGSFVPQLLGEPMVPSTVLRFWTAMVVAIEVWEPRFKVKKIAYPPQHNSAERMRTGALSVMLLGEYRPRGHLGDPTPEFGDRSIIL
jgi:phage baseplate assembly protein W